ncbi:MAG TPA: penicillin-binding transpeptidase domain-containing protein, partial [Motiliproteus sp.]
QLTEGGRFYRDWKRWGHGQVDLKTAIAESCDTFFYEVGHKMGVDPMSDYLGRFGFGKVTSLDLPEATAAILPSKAWKKRVRGRPWYTGDSLNLSIGQGFMLATPLQLATATMTLANRGKWHNPRLLKQKLDQPDFTLDVPESKQMADVSLRRDSYWDFINRSMQEVMHGEHGTARRSGLNASYRIAGKTGTAQVVGIKQDEKYDAENLAERLHDHGLFVGFAPADDPRIVVAVVVENGGGGSGSAAPVARELFDFFMLGEQSVVAATASE